MASQNVAAFVRKPGSSSFSSHSSYCRETLQNKIPEQRKECEDASFLFRVSSLRSSDLANLFSIGVNIRLKSSDFELIHVAWTAESNSQTQRLLNASRQGLGYVLTLQCPRARLSRYKPWFLRTPDRMFPKSGICYWLLGCRILQKNLLRQPYCNQNTLFQL